MSPSIIRAYSCIPEELSNKNSGGMMTRMRMRMKADELEGVSLHVGSELFRAAE